MLNSAFRPQVHGHRGCRGLLPENTLPAFLHALQLGVDVLEMDVVISADQQVVVSHEPWLSSTLCLDANGQRISPSQEQQHNLYQLPYATIRQCDCGALPHPEFPQQQRVSAPKPLLREVLRAVEDKTQQLGRSPVGYSIEIKSSVAGDNIYHPSPAVFSELVVAELNSAAVAARTTVLSFDPRILQQLHGTWSTFATCLLLEADQPWLPNIQRLGFVPTVLGPDFTTVTAEAVQHLRNAYPGLALVPWTVNQPADLQRLTALGADGITTDYPDRAIALLRG